MFQEHGIFERYFTAMQFGAKHTDINVDVFVAKFGM